MGRILVIRGGAVGDFLLTLPSVSMLRRYLPDNRLAVLGYKPVITVSEAAGLADEVRSMEHGPLARFFVPAAEIDPDWRDYFLSFNLVVSYLHDPDDIFHGNLRRLGVPTLLQGRSRVLPGEGHAVDQLSEVLAQLAIYPEPPDRALRLRFGEPWTSSAREFLGGGSGDVFALHPGSGSPWKNWELSRWARALAGLRRELPEARFLIATGEAEEERVGRFLSGLREEGFPFLHADSLPLPLLGAILSRCRAFVGHDSGVGHLAALCGLPSVLLFGPTEPAEWAPPHESVTVVQHPSGVMDGIEVEAVVRAGVDAWQAGRA